MTCVQAMVVKYVEKNSITTTKIYASHQHGGGVQEAIDETKRRSG
jgi:hypothetical protein